MPLDITDGLVDERTDGQMNGRTDVWLDEQIEMGLGQYMPTFFVCVLRLNNVDKQ